MTLTTEQFERLPRHAKDAIRVLEQNVAHWRRVALRQVVEGDSNTHLDDVVTRTENPSANGALPHGSQIEFRLVGSLWRASSRDYTTVTARVDEGLSRGGERLRPDVVRVASPDGTLHVTPHPSNVIEVRVADSR